MSGRAYPLSMSGGLDVRRDRGLLLQCALELTRLLDRADVLLDSRCRRKRLFALQRGQRRPVFLVRKVAADRTRHEQGAHDRHKNQQEKLAQPSAAVRATLAHAFGFAERQGVLRAGLPQSFPRAHGATTSGRLLMQINAPAVRSEQTGSDAGGAGVKSK